MRVLQDQRRAAIRDGDVGEVARLQELIRALRRQRNDLSFRALRELEDSVDLRLIIDDLQKATKALHDEEIGRAHVSTPVTNAHLVCRLLLEKKKNQEKQNTNQRTKIMQAV